MRKILLLIIAAGILPFWSLAQCGEFYDGYESGGWGATYNSAGGSFTNSFPSTGSAVGNRHWELTGNGGHFSGYYVTFNSSQPDYISFRFQSQTNNQHNTYFVIGDANATSSYGTIWIYREASNNNLRFYANSSTDYQHAVSTGSWYHVELKNINYTTYTYDIWIDGTLQYTGMPFRNNTNTIDRIYFYHLGTSTGKYDEVIVGGNPVSLATTSTDPLCAGDTTGSASVTATGGTPNYTYAWSTGASTNSISNLSAGTYYVSVSDSAGCMTTDSVTITAPTALSAALSANSIVCPDDTNGTVDLTPSGGTGSYTYLWNTGATTEDLSGLSAGTYSVVVTDSNGCSVTDSAAIGGPGPWNLQITSTNVSCNGYGNGSADLTVGGGTPGYTYAWSNGSSFQDLTGVTAGSYTVSVTDSLGCVTTSAVTITEPDSLLLSATATDLNCAGDQSGAIMTTVTGGTPTYGYSWSNGGTSADLTGVAGGSYSVTITDANGCTETDTWTLNEPPAITSSGAVTGDNGTSNGAIDLTAGGGTPSYTYSWSNGATTEDLSGIASGTYTVTITDANGCTLADTFVVEDLVAIADLWGNPEISVYPNPTKDEFLLSVSQMQTDRVELSIWDIHGKSLYSSEEQIVSGGLVKTLSLEPFAKGMYFLSLKSKDGSAVIRVIRE